LLELTCGQFHPDGHLFAAGATDGNIYLYDVKSGEEAARFEAGATLQALSFSENGTLLASVSKGQTTVSVWDLRKAAVVNSIETGSGVESVKWDYTGQFLAVAGSGSVSVHKYDKKAKSFSEPFKKAIAAAAVAWGANAQSLVTVTANGGLSVFGAAAS